GPAHGRGHGRGEDVDEAGASVGERERHGGVLASGAPPALGDGAGGLGGGHGAGELVGSYEDAHTASLIHAESSRVTACLTAGRHRRGRARHTGARKDRTFVREPLESSP